VTTIPSNPLRLLAALALTAVLVTGCGNDGTPADAAPELAAQLARVDRAVANGDEAQIRVRVESLVTATEAARDSGELDDEQADRILAAANSLLHRLPAEEPSPKPPPPPPSPTASPSPDEDEHEGEDAGHGNDEHGHGKDKHDKGKGHKDD
jgi:hypothetical protein